MSEQHYRITLDANAEKQFSKLDKAMQRRITIASRPARSRAAPSWGQDAQGRDGQWRIRVGDWRVIYTINDGELLVLVVEIGHRSKVYKGA